MLLKKAIVYIYSIRFPADFSESLPDGKLFGK